MEIVKRPGEYAMLNRMTMKIVISFDLAKYKSTDIQQKYYI